MLDNARKDKGLRQCQRREKRLKIKAMNVTQRMGVQAIPLVGKHLVELSVVDLGLRAINGPSKRPYEPGRTVAIQGLKHSPGLGGAQDANTFI